MITRELAVALKTAGLVWEPKQYDYFQIIVMEQSLTTCLTDMHSLELSQKEDREFRHKHRLWLPRLDQLITEIEKRGYTIWLNGPRNDEGADMKWSFSLVGKNRFYAETPEQAAGQALLWILQKEGNIDDTGDRPGE